MDHEPSSQAAAGESLSLVKLRLEEDEDLAAEWVAGDRSGLPAGSARL